VLSIREGVKTPFGEESEFDTLQGYEGGMRPVLPQTRSYQLAPRKRPLDEAR
jgi:hypothetical protein